MKERPPNSRIFLIAGGELAVGKGKPKTANGVKRVRLKAGPGFVERSAINGAAEERRYLRGGQNSHRGSFSRRRGAICPGAHRRRAESAAQGRPREHPSAARHDAAGARGAGSDGGRGLQKGADQSARGEADRQRRLRDDRRAGVAGGGARVRGGRDAGRVWRHPVSQLWGGADAPRPGGRGDRGRHVVSRMGGGRQGGRRIWSPCGRRRAGAGRSRRRGGGARARGVRGAAGRVSRRGDRAAETLRAERRAGAGYLGGPLRRRHAGEGAGRRSVEPPRRNGRRERALVRGAVDRGRFSGGPRPRFAISTVRPW